MQLPRQLVGTEDCIEFMYLKYTAHVLRVSFGTLTQPLPFLLLWSVIAETAAKAITVATPIANNRVLVISLHLGGLF